MIKTIQLSEDAFTMFVAAAAEVYPNETFGCFLGYKRKHILHIKYAIPYQATRRRKNEVSVVMKAEKRLLETMFFLKGYKLVGEFHSHPEGATALSKHDIKDMRESGDCISGLIMIQEWDEYSKWEYKKDDKCLQGCIDDKYFIMIKFYQSLHGQKKITKLKIKADFIKKLNKRHKI